MDLERHEYDVVVIGAGGAGLRAAIEAHALGAKTAIVCKSLLGKAHTVMAEGGIAAALGNVWPEDNWQVHFRDTMRGGKLLNNWRMAQLHAQEAPDRVLELEEWGALFDRTKDGLILQRDFGGHRYARLAHVGDRTGLEMIRTLQDHAVANGIDVFMECTLRHLLNDGQRVTGAIGYWRQSGKLIAFGAKAVVLATGGVGKAWKVTSNSWEYTGDGIAMALEAGADLIDMEMTQFHPTAMVWPLSVRGILVTEGVRGDGGTLKNSKGERFMFKYIPEFFRSDTADAEREVAAGMHGANRLGGNSLSDLLVFGKRAGQAAAEYSKRTPAPRADEGQQSAYAQRFAAPFERGGDENPYAIHAELQDTMQELVGIIRRRDELEEALARLERLRARAARAGVKGGRVYNPGWHLALDLENLIAVSETVARSALVREESRGGHTREDFPKPDPVWGTKNVVTRKRDGRLTLTTEPIPPVPGELRALIGEDKPGEKVPTGSEPAVVGGKE